MPDLSTESDLLELVEQPLKDVTRNEDAYCLGMIDILEAWNGGWAAQGCFLNCLGSLTGFPGNPRGITAIEPYAYAWRFEEFMHDKVTATSSVH